MIQALSEEECSELGIELSDLDDINRQLMEFKKAGSADREEQLREQQLKEWEQEKDLWDLQKANYED